MYCKVGRLHRWMWQSTFCKVNDKDKFKIRCSEYVDLGITSISIDWYHIETSSCVSLQVNFSDASASQCELSTDLGMKHATPWEKSLQSHPSQRAWSRELYSYSVYITSWWTPKWRHCYYSVYLRSILRKIRCHEDDNMKWIRELVSGEGGRGWGNIMYRHNGLSVK